MLKFTNPVEIFYSIIDMLTNLRTILEVSFEFDNTCCEDRFN